MPATPTTHQELIEPLQSFLETLAQELTEQKFVPALRGELQKLQGALEGLEQAQGTLQQIARGVDRLREVFAPAGTRLLEGVKDVESILRTNAGQLREHADGVLQDLLHTHEQLEAALRNEATSLSEQTSVSREALNQTIAGVDARLAALNAQVEGLCQRLETDAVPAQAAPALALAGESGAPMTGELRELVAHSEQAIGRELERHHLALSEAIRQNQSAERERLVHLDQRIEQALTTVGPRVQEELESAVTRLRDQLQTLLLAELETRTPHAEAPRKGAMVAAGASSAEITAALTASETRVLRELSALEKTQREDQGEAVRLLRELASGLEAGAARSAERAAAEGRAVREALDALPPLLTQLTAASGDERERLTALQAQLAAIASRQAAQQAEDQTAAAALQSRLEAQAQVLGQMTTGSREQHGQLASAIEHATAAVRAASEKALADSRQRHDQIAGALGELRGQLDSGLSATEGRLHAALQLAHDEWLAAVASLRDFMQQALTGLGRVGASLDQRLDALKGNAAEHQASVDKHLGTVATDIGALRAKQEQALPVLKEAIRANYDENAARLRELIEAAYENFARQVSQVPQALERYTHLLQSLHQGDQLALQAITSDTRNIIALASEKFDILIGDSGGVKKFLPLLDRKLEKHAAEIDHVRKAQTRQDKDFADVRAAIAAHHSASDEQTRELRGAAEEQFAAARAEVADLQTRVKTLADDALPALRRDLVGLITGKLEFIDGTLHERQEALRHELITRLDGERKTQQRISLSLAVLLALSIGLQIFFHLARTPGAGQ